MKQEDITKWVTALRSGEYEQGKGALRNTSGSHTSYCCLGVFGAVTGLAITSMGTRFEKDNTVVADNGEYYPCIPLGKEQKETLVYLNDGNASKDILSTNFSEIADWIETNIKAEANDIGA